MLILCLPGEHDFRSAPDAPEFSMRESRSQAVHTTTPERSRPGTHPEHRTSTPFRFARTAADPACPASHHPDRRHTVCGACTRHRTQAAKQIGIDANISDANRLRSASPANGSTHYRSKNFGYPSKRPIRITAGDAPAVSGKKRQTGSETVSTTKLRSHTDKVTRPLHLRTQPANDSGFGIYCRMQKTVAARTSDRSAQTEPYTGSARSPRIRTKKFPRRTREFFLLHEFG